MGGARIRLSLLVILAAGAAVLGMRAGRQVHPPEEPRASLALAPVERPAGLLAEVIVVSPDAAWRKLQHEVGGMMLFAPPTFGSVVAGRAGVPEMGHSIDGSAPAYGVVDGAGAWVVAARMTSPTLARTSLALPVVERVGDIEVHAGADGRSVGLADPWILLGSSRDAITRLGPYAHRNLAAPGRALPQSLASVRLDAAALSGPVREWASTKLGALEKYLVLRDEQERRAHGGRAPDLADTKPIEDLVSRVGHDAIDVASAMQSAVVELDANQGSVSARVTLEPAAAGSPSATWVDALEGAPAPMLGGANADALATLYWRSNARTRRETATAAADLLKSALGSRVPAADVGRLADVLGRAEDARGDWAMLSAESHAGLSLLLRASASDTAALASCIGDAVDVVRKPAWSAWEQGALGVTKIERKASRATVQADTLAVAAEWRAREGEVDVGAGLDASSALAGANPVHTVSTDPRLAPWTAMLGSDVVWVVLARPLLLASSPRSDPAMLALLHVGSVAQVRAVVPGLLLRQLVSM